MKAFKDIPQAAFDARRALYMGAQLGYENLDLILRYFPKELKNSGPENLYDRKEELLIKEINRGLDPDEAEELERLLLLCGANEGRVLEAEF